jgi:DNA-3-methyladenine glycosylase
MKRKLGKAFYQQEDVVALAKLLIGKVLVSALDNTCCSGIITETEAYNGIHDKASHAYGGRRTARTETMYATGGCAYVYLCYGIHSLFNVVTGKADHPQAILIRGIQPLEGIDLMEKRRKMKTMSRNFSNGPGKVSEAMGFHFSHSGISLFGQHIWIEDRGISIENHQLEVTPRIGVDYAADDALLPWRFVIKEEIKLTTSPRSRSGSRKK